MDKDITHPILPTPKQKDTYFVIYFLLHWITVCTYIFRIILNLNLPARQRIENVYPLRPAFIITARSI